MTVPIPPWTGGSPPPRSSCAAGNSWEAVATSLHCKATTCRRWPVRYRLRWRELYAAAAERRDAELRAEAQTVLRAQLRLDNIKEKRGRGQGHPGGHPPRP